MKYLQTDVTSDKQVVFSQNVKCIAKILFLKTVLVFICSFKSQNNFSFCIYGKNKDKSKKYENVSEITCRFYITEQKCIIDNFNVFVFNFISIVLNLGTKTAQSVMSAFFLIYLQNHQ